jgi:hypothetical protein
MGSLIAKIRKLRLGKKPDGTKHDTDTGAP